MNRPGEKWSVYKAIIFPEPKNLPASRNNHRSWSLSAAETISAEFLLPSLHSNFLSNFRKANQLSQHLPLSVNYFFPNQVGAAANCILMKAVVVCCTFGCWPENGSFFPCSLCSTKNVIFCPFEAGICAYCCSPSVVPIGTDTSSIARCHSLSIPLSQRSTNGHILSTFRWAKKSTKWPFFSNKPVATANKSIPVLKEGWNGMENMNG